MADGDSTNISEVLGTISDAVVKPVGEEVGRMIEAGKQSVASSGDPQDQAKKQQQEAEQKAKDAKGAAYQRQFLSELAAAEAKVRQEKAQKRAATGCRRSSG